MKFITPLTLTGLLTFTAVSYLVAQDLPMKWGDIPEEDLRMTVYEADSSAAAVVLADYGDVTFEVTTQGPRYNLDRHRRIKILKRSAFDEGDISISYIAYNKVERLSGLKAQLFTPDGEKHDLKKRDFFEEKQNEYLNAVNFSLPNVQEGAVIEYQYRLTCESLLELPQWYFQEDIPVRWSEYRLHIPEWYHYVSYTQGRQADISESTQTNELMRIPGSRTYQSSGTVDIEVHHHRFAMKDVPALKEESYITTMDDYYARVRFQLSAIQYDTYKPILSNWPKVAEELMSHSAFGEQLSRKNNFKDLLKAAEPVMAGAATDEEKLARAYAFLSKEMEWDGTHSMYVRDDLDACFEQRKGNSGELNLMLVALLQEYGLEAYPMLVSTRTNGKVIQIYPIVDQFNHALAVVHIGDKVVPIDLGSPLRPAGLPRISSLNQQGWVVKPGNPQWIPLQAPESRSVVLADFVLDDAGALSGSMKKYHVGYSAVNERESLREDPSGAFLEKNLKERYPEATVDSVRIEKLEKIDEELIENVYCRIPDGVMAAGDLMYLSAVVQPSLAENPFKLEKRLFPVDIPYPINDQYMMSLRIPEGYVVEELPEPVNLVTPGNGARVMFMVQKKNERELQVVSQLKIEQLHYKPDEYTPLREIFARLIEKQEEQIVLRKQM